MSVAFDALKEREKKNEITSFSDMETMQKNFKVFANAQEAMDFNVP